MTLPPVTLIRAFIAATLLLVFGRDAFAAPLTVRLAPRATHLNVNGTLLVEQCADGDCTSATRPLQQVEVRSLDAVTVDVPADVVVRASFRGAGVWAPRIAAHPGDAIVISALARRDADGIIHGHRNSGRAEGDHGRH